MDQYIFTNRTSKAFEISEAESQKLRPANSNKDLVLTSQFMAESVSMEVTQTQGVMGDFPSSFEPITSLGIERKSENPEEPCSLSPPKLESLDLGEDFKFDDFPFLKYPRDIISEKSEGFQESITESKCVKACISAVSEPRAIESEQSII